MVLNLHKRYEGAAPLTHAQIDENWDDLEDAVDWLSATVVTPQMHGAVGDGVADDTAAVRAAHATGQFVWYPAVSGYYNLASLAGVPIELTSSCDGDNVEIRAPSTGNGNNRVFGVTNSTRPITIGRGLTINGSYNGSGTSGEQDHLVYIRGSRNVSVFATLKNAYGDNVYIGNYTDSVVSGNILVDAVLENPRRCNVAVVCCDGAVLKGRYSKTVDYVSSIDMEPNTGAAFDYVRNIKIDLEEIDAPVGIIATANNGTNNIGCTVRVGRARCKYLFDIGTTALMKDMVIEGVGEFREWDSTRGKFGQFHTVDGLTIRDVRDIGACTNDSFNRWDFTNCTRVHIDDVYVNGGGIRQGPRITGCSDVLLGPGCRFVDLDDGGSTTATGGIELSNVTRLTTYANIECDSPCYLIKTGGLFTSRFLGGVLNSAISGIRNDQASSTYEIGLGVQSAGAMASGFHNPASGTVFRWEKHGPVSVAEYGATGDGTTDVTTAFTRMYASGAKEFFIPAGEYVVSSITPPVGSITHTAGFATIIQQKTGVSVGTRIVNIAQSDIVFAPEGITLQGNIASDTDEQNFGIFIRGAADIRNIRIGDVYGEDIRGDVVYVGGLSTAKVNDVRIGAVSGENILRNVVSVTGGENIHVDAAIVITAAGYMAFDVEPNSNSQLCNAIHCDYVKGRRCGVVGLSTNIVNHVSFGCVDLNESFQVNTTPTYSSFTGIQYGAFIVRNFESVEVEMLRMHNCAYKGIWQPTGVGDYLFGLLTIGALEQSTCGASDPDYNTYNLGSCRLIVESGEVTLHASSMSAFEGFETPTIANLYCNGLVTDVCVRPHLKGLKLASTYDVYVSRGTGADYRPHFENCNIVFTGSVGRLTNTDYATLVNSVVVVGTFFTLSTNRVWIVNSTVTVGNNAAINYRRYLWPIDPVNPYMFGAVGDGTTNDTTALQSFLSALGSGIHGVLEGTFRHNTLLVVSSKSNFKLTGHGTIKMLDAVATSGDVGGGIRFVSCSDFVLEDFTVDGNRAGRTIAGETGSHGLNFRSCHRFTLSRVKSKDSCADGYYMASSTPATKSTHSDFFSFLDCIADNCWRQGASIIQGNNGRFKGGYYSNSNGGGPEAGIDLEPNSGDADYSVEKITIEDVLFENNYRGLLVSQESLTRDIHVLRCLFKGNEAYQIEWAGTENGLISDCVFDGVPDTITRGAIDLQSDASIGDLAIVRPTFRNVAFDGAGQWLVYVDGNSHGKVRIAELRCDSCYQIASLGPDCWFDDGIIDEVTGAVGVFAGVGGDRCKVRRNKISNFTTTAIYLSGDHVEVSDNQILETAANSANGCIRVLEAGGIVERNYVYRATPAAGYGIRMDASFRSLQDNQVEGFTGNPLYLTGGASTEAIGFMKRNITNGARATEN